LAELHVRVKPRSSRDAITGFEAGFLLVQVTAPPDDGKANAAVIKLLAKELGVPKTSITVKRGATARIKTLEIKSLTQEELNDYLLNTTPPSS
jgi:uncharacterized protein (TIGR00251 family)